MSGESFLRVTVNPRLEFGVPLKQVCNQELLHPGLKELFLKAYISAIGDDHADEEQDNGKLKSSRVLEALRAGPKGQGSVAERISLKSKLESGKWIVAAQTPSGAPLWLIRHFFGLLPQPLLHESHWEMIAIICGISTWLNKENFVDEILEKIVTSLKALPIEHYSMLEALLLLIRNLGTAKMMINGSIMLNRKVIQALSQYFTAAIFSRPYRPGLHTTLDKLHEPLLVFLAEHWLEVKEFCGDCGVSRYHRNKCQLRYELVSPDGEASSAELRAPNTEKIINDKIDIDPCSVKFVRKAVQRSSETTSSRSNFSSNNPENDEQENKTQNDVLLATDIRKMKIESGNVLTAIRAPVGVYLSSENKKSNDASAAIDHERSSKNPKKDSLLLLRSNGDLDCRYVELDVKENGCECPLSLPQAQDETFKDKTSEHLNSSEVEKLVFRYGHRGDTAINGTGQASKVNSPNDRTKANGTQTFECEFPEVISSTGEIKVAQSEVLQLRVKMAEDNSDDMKRKRDDDDTLAVTVASRRLNFIKLSDETNENRAIIPLTRSTAMLIKNFANFDNRIICLVTRKEVSKANWRNRINDLAKIENTKIIEEAVGNLSVKSQMNDQSFGLRVDKPNVKTLTNPLKEVNNEKRDDRKKHSDDNDFIFELKKKIQARS